MMHGTPPFLLLLLIFVLFPYACGSGVANHPEYAAGEILVKFKKDVSREEAKSLHSRCGSKILKHFERINADLVQIKEGWTVEQAIKAYQDDPSVEYVEPNYTRRIQTK
jgi:thermitase